MAKQYQFPTTPGIEVTTPVVFQVAAVNDAYVAGGTTTLATQCKRVVVTVEDNDILICWASSTVPDYHPEHYLVVGVHDMPAGVYGCKLKNRVGAAVAKAQVVFWS